MTTELEAALAKLRDELEKSDCYVSAEFDEAIDRYEATIRELVKGVDFNTDHPDWRVHSHPRLALCRATKILKGES